VTVHEERRGVDPALRVGRHVAGRHGHHSATCGMSGRCVNVLSGHAGAAGG
jgi:hypothetical protein